MAPKNITRVAAMSLVSSGIATFAEAAQLAGTSRQLIRYWAGSDGVETTTEAREQYLAEQWRKALKSAEKGN